MQQLYSDEQYDYALLRGQYGGFAVDLTLAIVNQDVILLRQRTRDGEKDIYLTHREVGELLELLSAYKKRREAASAPEQGKGK
jgi:uncharacterized protein (DUF1499 family)